MFRPPAKISQLLRPVKDDLGLRTPGIYKIPCECGKVYIGQTGRTVQDRIKEHQRCIKLADFDKSAVAEHSLLTGHRILLSSTTVVDKATNYYDRIIKEDNSKCKTRRRRDTLSSSFRVQWIRSLTRAKLVRRKIFLASGELMGCLITAKRGITFSSGHLRRNAREHNRISFFFCSLSKSQTLR